MCVPLALLELVPSPQFRVVFLISFSGSLQLPFADTGNGAVPEVGATVRAHVGGTFTVTVCDAEPVKSPESVAVTVTVNCPVLVYI